MCSTLVENRTDQIKESLYKSKGQDSNELSEADNFEEQKACKMLRGVTKKIRKDKEKNFKLKTLMVK